LRRDVLSQSRTVLLVEDEDVVRAVTQEMLEGAGHTVVAAANGREALELVSGGLDVDVVVTDTVMPGLGGIELAHELTARALDVPVILVSGYAGDGVDLDDVAVAAFLQKPYTTSALLAAVEDVLEAFPPAAAPAMMYAVEDGGSR
jgi:CheY-like chemotaxis protein